METEGSLPHSQEPAYRLCADPDQTSPTHNPTSLRFILILFPHLRLSLPNGLFPSSFPTKTRYALSSSPCVLHARPSNSFWFDHRDKNW
jgi:hypothetical protein